MVILNEGGIWLKSADVKPGETIKILTSGEWIQNTRYKYDNGDPKQDFVVDIIHGGAEKKWRVNMMNRETLKSMFGKDTEEWVGKEVRINTETVLAGGKRLKVIMVVKVDKDGKEVSWDE